jgi:hypothetical protein
MGLTLEVSLSGDEQQGSNIEPSREHCTDNERASRPTRRRMADLDYLRQQIATPPISGRAIRT